MQEYNQEEYEIDLREYLDIIYQRKWLIIIITLIAVTASYLYTVSLPEIYEAQAVLMVDESSTGMVGNLDSFPFEQNNRELMTYSRLFKMRNLLEKVSSYFPQEEDINFTYLNEMLTVNIMAETNLIKLSLKHHDSRLAREILNRIITEFTSSNRRLKIVATSSARQYVEEQLAKVAEELKGLEIEVKLFKEEHGVIILSEYAKKLLEQVQTLEEKAAVNQLEINSRRAAISHLRLELPLYREKIVTSQTISRNPVINTIKQRLIELELKLASYHKIYTTKHPEIMKLESEKDRIMQELANTVEKLITSEVVTDNPLHTQLTEELITLETELAASEAEQKLLQLQLEEYQVSLESLPGEELEYSRLERNLQVTEKLYTMLLTRYQELKISEAMEISDLIMVDPPFAPEKPVGPNLKLNLVVALMLGLFAGIFIVFLLKFLDFTIHKPEELEELTDIPVLGYIPVNNDKGQNRDKS